MYSTNHFGCNLLRRLALPLGGVLLCLHFSCTPLAAATVTWVGTNGDWNIATNWSTGALPGANDDVVIGSGPAITVTHSSGTHGVHSVLSQQAFVLSGGTLSISTTFVASNTFTLSGGTLQSATLAASSTFPLVVQNGTLNGVTINGVLDVGNTTSGALVTVTNGLALNGTLLVGNPTNNWDGGVSFAGTQTLGGNGAVVFGFNPSANGLFLAYNGTTLTIGPSVTVRGQTGTIGYSGYFASSSSAGVVNQGTISCDVNGGELSINPQSFVNEGLIQGTNGGTIALTGTIIPSAGAFNGSVQLVSGATVQGGTITTLNGSALAVNGSVILAAVTVATNSILDVGNTFGSALVTVTNGLVLNGTLLVGNPSNNWNGGVSFAGTQTLSGNGTVVFGYNYYSQNGLFLAYNGTTLTIGPAVTVRGQTGTIGYSEYFTSSSSAGVVNQGTISCDVNGEVISVNPQNFANQGLVQGTNGGAVNLGGAITPQAGSLFNGLVQLVSGATVQGGTITTLNGSAVAANTGVTLAGVTVATNSILDVGNTFSSALVTVTNGLVLNGTLLVGNPTNNWNGGVSFAGTQTLSGNGTVVFGYNYNNYNGLFLAYNGTTLTIGPAVTVRGQTGTIGYAQYFTSSASAGVVNQGTISCDLNGGVISVNPQSFANQGLVQGTNGGGVNLGGTITLQAGSLFNGSVQLVSGATVQGGTITTLNGSAVAANSGVTLAGVTVATNSILDVGNTVSGALVTVTNGLVLNGTLLVGNSTNFPYGGVGFAGTQTLNGNGVVVFGDSYYGYNGLFPTINGTTLTIGPSITVRGQYGTIGHSSVFSSASTATVVNQGTISGDSSSYAIVINPTTFTTTGKLNGSVQAANGTTILGGTIITINGSAFALNSGVTLNGVIVNGTLDVGSSINGIAVTVTNGLVLNGTLLVGNPTNSYYGGVGFAGTQTLSGSGVVVFGNNYNGYNGLYPANNGTTLTLGPSITVRGQYGSIGHSSVFSSASSATVVNQGAISGDSSSYAIVINPATFTTTGTLNGSVQAASGTTILNGTIVTINGSALVLNSGVVLNGATVNGTLDVGSSINAASVTVTNGLVLNGTLLVGNPTNYYYGGVGFAGTQTLSGNGTVVFGNNYNNYNGLFPIYNGTTLTLGPSITVRGQIGNLGHSSVFSSASSANVDNEGSISCDVSGGTITVNPQNFTNQGALSAAAGAVLSLTGTNSLTGGSLTLDLGGAANYGKLNISGNVTLGGPLNVNLTGGYVPTAGTSFSIVSYGSETGSFAPTNFPGQALQWQLNYGATVATLTVTTNLATIVDIAYLRSTLDPVNFAPTNTSTLYTAVGVVTTWTNLTSAGNTEFFMQDASGGIAVLWSGATASNNLPPAGSLVEVTSPLAEDNGLLVLEPVFSNPLHGVTIQGTSPLPAPQPLPFDTNIVGNPNLMVRHLQGTYFLATNVFLDLATSTFTAGATEPLTNSTTLPITLTLFNSTSLTAGTNYTITATNLPGQTFVISYNSNADFIGQAKLPGPFAIYGVLGQYVTNAPYTSGYQFIPTRKADLLELGPPGIVSQPTNQILSQGANATFAVTATGASPLNYQWFYDGSALSDSNGIAGSQSSVLSITNVQSSESGTYEVVVTNLYGSVTSSPALLSVANLPDLAVSNATAPASVTASQPNPAISVSWAVTNLSLGVAPGGWYDRVWFSTNGVLDANSLDVGDYYHGQNLAPGAGYVVTTSVNLPMNASGPYWLFVQVDVYDYITETTKGNNLSPALAGTFTLIPPDLTPVSLSAPASASWGSTVPIACIVTNQGGGGISNDWADGIYYSTNAVFGSNAVLLTYVFEAHSLTAGAAYGWTNLTALPPVVAGNYYFFVVADDPSYAGGAYTIFETSKANNLAGPAGLTILAGPTPTLQTVSPSIGLTNGGTLVTIGGTGFEPGAQIFFGAQAASSVTVYNSTQITAYTPPGPLGVVDVQLMNPDGNMASLHNGYTYTGPPPSISVQPATISVPLGSNANFQVTASYVDTYQWRFNGGNLVDNGRITGSHSSSLNVSSVQSADAGSYQVILSNVYGYTTSVVATLSVIVPPAITNPPQSQAVGIGGTAAFTVGVSGSAPFNYQWLQGSSPLTGATASTLILTNVQTTNQGSFSVVVSNAAGSVTSAPAVLTVLDYCASVQVGQPVYPMGTTVPLTVSTFNCSNQIPVPNSSAIVWISTGGTTRSLPVTTGTNGSTVANFVPLATEAGTYQVAAALPGQNIPAAQGSFSLVGMALSTNQVSVQLIPGVPLTNTIALSNLTSIALTGVGAAVVGSAPDVQVQLNAPGTLSGYATNSLTMVFTAPTDAAAQDQFGVQLTTAQGSTNNIVVTATVVPVTPTVAVTPASLSATMAQGGQTLVNFAVVNVGGTTSGPVQVILPSAPWLATVTAQPMPPLAPGQSNTVTLALTPAANLPLGPYAGELDVVSGNSEVAVPFQFDCVSSLQGSLQVTVQDELSAYGAGSPNVSNATVSVTDFITGSNILTSVTGSSGILLFSNLASAYYSVAVSAPNHGSFSTTLLVKPNQTNDLTAFLPLNLVDYTWVVTPTTVPDHYEFTLETTFATEVPWPVVTISPGAIDLCSLSGPTNQIDLTITNSGLITAQGLNLFFGTHPDWSIQPLASDLGDLAPLSSVVVPVVITRLGSGTSVPHNMAAQLSYYVATPTQTNSTIVPVYVFDANPQDCEPESPTPPPVPITCTNCVFSGPEDTNSGTVTWGVPGGGAPTGGAAGGSGGGAGPTISFPSYSFQTPQGALVQVKLRIEQSAVIARDAFSATLQLANNSGAVITNLAVSLVVYDASNQVATSLFGIPAPQLIGLNAADGTGGLAIGASGSGTWTIIPATNAAPLAPTQFSVGGSFSYTVNGEPVTVPLFPVPITVLPTPILNVDYFLQHDVYSDDPFTPQIEPSIPFALGLLVQNKGHGSANDFTITSAQPQIIQNSNNLVIAFSIIGSQEGTNQSVSPSLTMDFGDIAPQADAEGLWYMTSTLEGQFVSFAASFQHVDDLGNTNTSLINQVRIHELNHVVRLTIPTDDGLPDFLVNDTTNVDALPDIVYSSDGSTDSVTSITNAVTTGTPSANNSNITLTASVPAGWVYLEVVDPGGGNYPIASVQRSDGTNLLVGPNVWQTPARIHMVPPKPNNLIHIFDYDSTGSYTITYGEQVSAPSVTTLAGVATNATSATLNALVNPNNASTTVFFNWGTTTNYGNTAYAPELTSQLNTSQDASAVLENLSPQTTYHFQAVALNSAGTSYGSDVSFTTPTLPPPVITNVGPFSIAVGQGLIFTNHASQSVIYSLGAGAPVGATLTTNGLFNWAPSCIEGTSTNLITVWATDIGSPSVSNSMTFLVTVGDCVQVGIGSTVVQGGQNGCVPVTLTSSLALTNLSFDLLANTNYLNGWSISSTNVDVGNSSVDSPTPGLFHFLMSAAPGHALTGPTILADLCFNALAGHSAFLPLTITNFQGTESNGVPAGNAVGQPGEVILVGIEPLLQATHGTNSAPMLLLYGKPGSNYLLQSVTSVASTNWQPGPSTTMTNLLQVFTGLGGSNGPATQFYRAVLLP